MLPWGRGNRKLLTVQTSGRSRLSRGIVAYVDIKLCLSRMKATDRGVGTKPGVGHGLPEVNFPQNQKSNQMEIKNQNKRMKP